VSGPASSLATIVRALGGELYDGGRRAVVPGPGHSAGDRSVSLLLSEGRVVAHSFAGDDWRAILEELRRRGLINRDNRLVGGATMSEPPRPSRPERLAAAASLWAQARALPGTLAERHVRSRGVIRDLSPALRFHPAVPASVYRDRGRRRPALLAEIRDAADGFAGVEVTYLADDGRTAEVTVPRKTVGGRPAGSAVRLDPVAAEMIVGEGVFSCLSASQVLGLPVWALLAVGNLCRWSVPPGVVSVVIAADRGVPGERGAAILARRLECLGLATAVRPPPAGFADWNDAVRHAETFGA
jgi:hypothetical protein